MQNLKKQSNGDSVDARMVKSGCIAPDASEEHRWKHYTIDFATNAYQCRRNEREETHKKEPEEIQEE